MAPLSATLLKVAFALLPSVVIAPMQTTIISASMTAYSTAVGPSSAFMNRTACRVSVRSMTELPHDETSEPTIARVARWTHQQPFNCLLIEPSFRGYGGMKAAGRRRIAAGPRCLADGDQIGPDFGPAVSPRLSPDQLAPTLGRDASGVKCGEAKFAGKLAIFRTFAPI